MPNPGVGVFDRRKEYRLDIRVPISIVGIHPQTLEPFKVDTFTQNVSRFGAGFELEHGMASLGSLLDLFLGNRFEAKCRVVWLKESENGTDQVGVEFISTSGQWVLYN